MEGFIIKGIFWLAPENHQWQHFEAKTFKDVDKVVVQSEVAPEIAATKQVYGGMGDKE